jgi:hypothetical protein
VTITRIFAGATAANRRTIRSTCWSLMRPSPNGNTHARAVFTPIDHLVVFVFGLESADMNRR